MISPRGLSVEPSGAGCCAGPEGRRTPGPWSWRVHTGRLLPWTGRSRTSLFSPSTSPSKWIQAPPGFSPLKLIILGCVFLATFINSQPVFIIFKCWILVNAWSLNPLTEFPERRTTLYKYSQLSKSFLPTWTARCFRTQWWSIRLQKHVIVRIVNKENRISFVSVYLGFWRFGTELYLHGRYHISPVLVLG